MTGRRRRQPAASACCLLPSTLWCLPSALCFLLFETKSPGAVVGTAPGGREEKKQVDASGHGGRLLPPEPPEPPEPSAPVIRPRASPVRDALLVPTTPVSPRVQRLTTPALRKGDGDRSDGARPPRLSSGRAGRGLPSVSARPLQVRSIHLPTMYRAPPNMRSPSRHSAGRISERRSRSAAKLTQDPDSWTRRVWCSRRGPGASRRLRPPQLCPRPGCCAVLAMRASALINPVTLTPFHLDTLIP
jgi:hypothetical protein